ncbi:Uncharacterised protein [Segatella copri]|nr:Uncharacterised protein [Segatella copri]
MTNVSDGLVNKFNKILLSTCMYACSMSHSALSGSSLKQEERVVIQLIDRAATINLDCFIS